MCFFSGAVPERRQLMLSRFARGARAARTGGKLFKVGKRSISSHTQADLMQQVLNRHSVESSPTDPGPGRGGGTDYRGTHQNAFTGMQPKNNREQKSTDRKKSGASG